MAESGRKARERAFDVRGRNRREKRRRNGCWFCGTNLVALIERLHENEALVHVLAADVDVARAGPHSRASDQAALEELVRVVAEDLTILRSK